MINTDVIKAAINAAVSAITNNWKPEISALPLKVPGRTFDIPNDQRYFEVVLITNDGADRTWGDERFFRGIIRIILHWTVDDTGIYSQIDLLETLAQSFKKGSHIRFDLADLLIIEHPKIDDLITNGHEQIFPLTIQYQCFAA